MDIVYLVGRDTEFLRAPFSRVGGVASGPSNRAAPLTLYGDELASTAHCCCHVCTSFCS